MALVHYQTRRSRNANCHSLPFNCHSRLPPFPTGSVSRRNGTCDPLRLRGTGLVPTEADRLSGRGLLVLGGPAFDASTLRPVASAASFRGTRSTCRDFQSIRFDPLPASVKEVDELLALWNRAHTTAGKSAQLSGVMPSTPDTIRLTGVAASEAAFKMEAGGRRILHLATHGFFLGGRCASALDSSSASTPAGLSTRIESTEGSRTRNLNKTGVRLWT